MTVIIAKNKNIQAHLVYGDFAGKSVPLEVYFTLDNDQEKRIILNLDAPDEVVLADLNPLANLPEHLHEPLLQCMHEVLYKCLGGKCLFNVPLALQEKVEKILYLEVKPVYPAGGNYDFFGRLMAAPGANETMQKKFLSYHDKFSELNEKYTFVTEKTKLQSYTSEASRFMVDNVDWARNQTYSKEGMECRFSNRIVTSYIACEKDDPNTKPATKKVDGMVRVTQEGNIYYVNDLAVRKENRGQGLAMKLLQQAISEIPPSGRIVLIAGDEKLVDLYKKLGFSLIAEKHPVSINNSVLMCRLISKQNKIEEFHKSLPEPAPPASHSPKSPRFNFREQPQNLKEEEEETEKETQHSLSTLSI